MPAVPVVPSVDVSVVASVLSMAWMMVDYHRSLRSFLPDKNKQSWLSSLLYFLWNLLLIGPRLACVALFASVRPYYAAAHFLLCWPALSTWAFLQRTRFMDSRAGEVLYRVTVGLVWYFSWFNVAEGPTRGRSLIYHTFILTDGTILLLTWWWSRDPEPGAYVLYVSVFVPLCYVLGLILKLLYYRNCHPTLGGATEPGVAQYDQPDGTGYKFQPDKSNIVNKRMAQHAGDFSACRNSGNTQREIRGLFQVNQTPVNT